MKILVLSHRFYPDIGGIETHSEILANAFHYAGHEVHLMTWTKDPGLKSFQYKIIRNPNIWQIIRECSWSEIVFENNVCLRLSWPHLFFKRPLITTLHTWLTRTDGKRGLQDFLKHEWLKRAKVVISCSNSIRKECWPESIVINNPYNDELFKIVSHKQKTINFVFLGRLVSDKGVEIAIQAISQLRKLNKNDEVLYKEAGLTIIGEGPERKALEDLVKALQLEECVQFKGALRGVELVECLNQHRYMIVPSKWDEPFGMVVLEGMACGCIPIVSNCGGLPDAVGKAGLTFKPGSVDALVETIQNVFNNKILEQQLRGAVNNHLAAHRSNFISHRYLEEIEKAIHLS